MNNFDRLNEVIKYIEDNLTYEISIEKICQILCVNEYSLYRIFNFITGISLTEYIRNRKLSMAGLELINSKIKIIDLKVEYQLTNKGALLFTTISWPIMMISKLLAYKDESIVIVAALCSLSVMINVIVGYFIFKEKGSVLKKIIAALLIIIGIILIKI